ncbi:MAG: lipopolysaccharide biosynthesis protein [Phormidesmis sp.]
MSLTETEVEPSSSQQAGKRFMRGTVWVFLAEALIFPTGLVTAGILTRQLGQEGYGMLTLVAVLVSWIEWTITSIFARTSIKFVSDAEDWQPVGAMIAQLHLLIGAVATAVIWIFAQPIAGGLGVEDPNFVGYLRLFSLDIPIFCLAYAHRQLLIGRGFFSQRAIASAGRWISRLAIIALLVEYAQWSVQGAILGSLGASFVELTIGRWFVRPPLLKRSSFPPQRLFGYALPLFLFATSLRLFDKLDLFMLKILGGTVEQVGVYGAAQNLASVPGIFALSFSPLLLSTLNRTLRTGDLPAAQQIGRYALRTIVALLPFAALAAAASVPIVSVVYGQAFQPAGPVLAVLIFASMALLLISVITAILTAAGRPNLTFMLVAPLLPISAAGYVWLVPRYGAMGACWANTGAAVFGVVAALLCLYRVWQIAPPLTTAIRSAIAGAIVYVVGLHWITPDFSFLLKLVALSLLIPVLLLCLGELSATERKSLGNWSQHQWQQMIGKVTGKRSGGT